MNRPMLQKGGRAAGLALLAALLLPVNRARAGTDRRGRQGRARHHLGPRRHGSRVLHAGGLRLPGDRLLAGKNVGAGIAKIVVNFSDRHDRVVGGRVRLAFGGAGVIAGDTGFFFQIGRDMSDGLPARLYGARPTAHAAFFIFQFMFCAVSLAIVWGIDARAHQVRRVPDLRDRVRGGHLPAGRPLGLRRRRVRRVRRRRAGLRRLVGGAPHGCDRRAGGVAACSARARASTAPTASRGPFPGHNVPLFGLGVLILWLGLVRLQRRLDARHGRQPLRRGRRGHQPRCRGRHPRRVARRAGSRSRSWTSA